MNWKRSLPSGTKDKLFREANGSFRLEQDVCQIFSNRGYQRVETPIIEFEDVFGSQNIQDSGRYRFFDPKGRLLVLRPDMTLPIGRVVATTGVTPPLQLYYSGKIFRSNDELAGNQNEQLQAGIEIIGYDSIKAEIECIVCAQEVMKKLKITQFHIEMGHAIIYQEILKELQLSAKDEEEFKMHLLNKSISELAVFVEEHPSSLDGFIRKLPWLFGEAEETIAWARELVDHEKILQAFDELLAIQAAVQLVDPAISLTVDLGLVQVMSYYTGTIFRGYADHTPDYFLSGGRYNHLLEQFGDQALPAVGLAFDLDTLVSLQYHLAVFPKQPLTKILIHYGIEDLALAEKLLAETPQSSLSLFDEDAKAIEFAKKWQYESVWIIKGSRVEKISMGANG